MSARDAARLGLLYLQGGTWQGEQLISEAWVDESTAPISDSGEYIPGTYYGYMWWVFPVGYGADRSYDRIGEHAMYAALGAYGQVIMVIPDLQLVFVHRVDSYSGHNVDLLDWMGLLDKILVAGPSESAAHTAVSAVTANDLAVIRGVSRITLCDIPQRAAPNRPVFGAVRTHLSPKSKGRA